MFALRKLGSPSPSLPLLLSLSILIYLTSNTIVSSYLLPLLPVIIFTLPLEPPKSTTSLTYRSTSDEFLLPTVFLLLNPTSVVPYFYLLSHFVPFVPTNFTVYLLSLFHCIYTANFQPLLAIFLTAAFHAVASNATLVTEKLTPSELYFSIHLLSLTLVEVSQGGMSDLTPDNVGVVGLCSFLLSATLSVSAVSVLNPPQPYNLFVPYAAVSASALTALFLLIYMFPKTDPVTWIFNLLILKSPTLQVLWYLTFGSLLSFLVHLVTLSSNIHVAVKRKLHHLALLVLFLPTLTDELRPVAILCALVGTCIFLVLEIVRWEMVKDNRRDILGEYWAEWLDDKDRKGGGYQVVISPVTLLVSPIIPSLVSPTSTNTVVKYIGLVAICVGDTLAASVGVKYGRHRIPFNGGSRRTLEGSLGCFLSVLGSVAIIRTLEGEGVGMRDVLGSGIIAGVEAGTSCIDNIVLPLVGGIAWAIN